MKILAINAFHYRRGGSETVYFNTAALLRANGHEVVEFALKWPENLASGYSDFFAESKESRKGLLKPVKNIVNYFYHFEAARNLDRLIRQERPDVAQVHLIWGQLTPSILKVLRRHKVPVVLTVHDFRIVCPASVMRNGRGEVCEQCRGHRFYKCVTNTCCKGSKALSAMMAVEQYTRNLFFPPASMIDGILYVSDFSRHMHEKYMPSLASLPSARIYNTASSVSPAPVAPAESPYYLYFGRLSHEKGVETLLRAFEQRPDLKLKIAGTGTLEASLRDYASQKGMTNVEFLGYRTGDELRSLVARARFVVVPSECYENNPLTIVEAYADGTPVIGASIGGIPEIIVDGATGFRFVPGDVDSLVKAIGRSESLSAVEYERMQAAALEFARKNFNPDNYLPALLSLFKTVCKK